MPNLTLQILYPDVTTAKNTLLYITTLSHSQVRRQFVFLLLLFLLLTLKLFSCEEVQTFGVMCCFIAYIASV